MASAKARRNKLRAAQEMGVPVQRGASIHTLSEPKPIVKLPLQPEPARSRRR